MRSVWWIAVLSSGLAACTPSEGEDDAGTGDGGRTRPICDVDRANDPASASVVTLGTPGLGVGQLCPATDQDWFVFDVPARGLVQLELGYSSGATTPVQVGYGLYGPATDPAQIDPNRPLFAGQDDLPGDNRSTLTRSHFLQTPGRYYLRLRDVGDDQEDRINRYNVTVKTVETRDPGEPNDTCGVANTITSSASGAVSYQGDQDAFIFTVPSGVRIVDLRLSVAARTTLDPTLKLYETTGQGANRVGSQLIGQVTQVRGEAGMTQLHLRTGLTSSGGTYCLIVSDDDGAQADAAATYTVLLAVENEPDAQDATRRNDTPDTATRIAPGGGTFTGVVASNADLDWFVIDQPIGRVAEVTVSCPGCGIQPIANLVYGDATSPCDAASTCDYLLVDPNRAANGGACQLDSDCESKVCRAIPNGQKRCARACGSDLECPGFSCNRVGQISACVGAAVCAAGQCGVLQYTNNPLSNGMALETFTTAQPLQGSPIYLLVHDLADDEFSRGNAPYTLTVTVRADPDPAEPNNYYYPFAKVPPRVEYNYGDVIARGRPAASMAAWRSGPGGAEASGSGCIGYAGDVDLFRIAGGNPCALTSTSGPGMRGNCGLQLTYSRPGGGQNLEWAVYARDFGLRSGFEAAAEGSDTVFGDASCAVNRNDQECFVYQAGDDGDYYLGIRDIGSDNWATSGADCYTWTLRAARTTGCPAACRTVNNQCTSCQ